jgi:hypothetical protein
MTEDRIPKAQPRKTERDDQALAGFIRLSAFGLGSAIGLRPSNLGFPGSLTSALFCPWNCPQLRPVKHIVSLLPLLAALAMGAAEFKPEPGFESIFNGKDLTGWGYKDAEGKLAVNDGQAATPDKRYSAGNGVLTVHPMPDGSRKMQILWTAREFPKNFQLKLEFRAGVNADSGIFLRKPQLQCRDYLVAGPAKYQQLKKYKAQDWNEIEVVVKDNVARCTCNGEVLEDALKLPATGGIGFEADRGTMEYRRVRIKELP